MELTFQDAMRFKRGLARWSESGKLKLSDLLPDKRGSLFLKFLYMSRAFNLFDEDFNGLSFDEACENLGIDVSITAEGLFSKDYELVPINSYEQAMRYHNLAPDWHILNGREIWDRYKHGNWKFIFIVNKNVAAIKRTVRPGFPYDTFGTSLMCFGSYSDGGAEELFTRWNGFDDPVWIWDKVLKNLLKERYPEIRALAHKQFHDA